MNGRDFGWCRAAPSVQWLGPRIGGISVDNEQGLLMWDILHCGVPLPLDSVEDRRELVGLLVPAISEGFSRA